EDRYVGTVIGIDLGTSYSCVGVFKNGYLEIIPNDQGNRITPSYVAFTNEGEFLIGDAAKNQLTTNPKNTVFNTKLLIGRRWSDRTVQQDIQYLPFNVIEKNEKPHIEVKTSDGNRIFAIEEISAMLLRKLKEDAEAYLGKIVTHAVVTVPAYFSDAQRQATKDAGLIAGLSIIRIINEPTAAAFAYGIIDQKVDVRNIIVFDLGGGTIDVSLLILDAGICEVLATNGDTHLGGEDFNHRVIDYYLKLYKRKTGKTIPKNHIAVQKLRREIERAKRLLSTSEEVKIEIESFFDGCDFTETLTRARFENLNIDLFRSTIASIQNVLNDSNLQKNDIDEIILGGGSTRIPKIQQLVKEFFNGKEPLLNINPDEAIASGAAFQANVLTDKENKSDNLLLDVTPHTVGIETGDGVMSKLIVRNTAIPTKMAHIFTTNVDDQDEVLIQVYEGEHYMTKDNYLLDTFILGGILPAPRGVPEIKVIFEIDANSILIVSAEEMKTGNKENITITNYRNRITHEDFFRMNEYSERLAEKDKMWKERIESRNELECYAYKLKNKVN
ncbi:unnamed protein product, partial [Meganyctiphanes norvegica]